MDDNSKLTLRDAAGEYLAGLSEEERGTSQPEVSRFVQWFGWEKVLEGLSAAEIGNYAERLSISDRDYMKKLEVVRAFLTHARNKGWSKTNLAVHLKPKKGKPKAANSKGPSQPEVVPVTQEGYDKLKEELEELKQQRPHAIEEITKAAADKDFRENAPLEAAREQHGLIEGRIREIEAILKAAAIVDNQVKISLKVNMGDSIVLVELESGEEMRYQIVGPRETNPSKGKISGVSPVGRAAIGKCEGETIEVTVPVGKICYQIKRIER